ncbi:MAG: DUF58 domain-containing protein [Planctomycetota bacterium]
MLTVWLLLAFGVVLGLLAWLGSVYPHRPMVVVMLVPTVLAMAMVFLPGIWPLVAIVDGLLLLVVGIDLLSLARQESFSVERSVGLIASLGKMHPVELTVTNRSGRRQPVWVRDATPEGMTAQPDEFCVVLSPLSRSVLRYQLRPQRRGEFFLDHAYLRVASRWGFWQRQLAEPCQSRVNVYPDMKQLGEYAILARTNRLSQMGLRRTRRIGQDNEFERLRDYTLDDNYKHIDWRSTARRNKLTVRDFQANQSQRIVFLVDCGRMMTGEAAGMSLLDHALNAMLMMAYVALQKSDQVGLMCFSDGIHSFTPPKGGREQMNHLLHAAYNRFPAMVESRYDEAFLHLASHVRKRTLVVLITNVVDEVNASGVLRHLKTISGRHLPLAVLLRDHALFDAVDQVEDYFDPATPSPTALGESTTAGPSLDNPFLTSGSTATATAAPPLSDERLFHAAAAAEILNWRRHVLADMETSGVLLVDEFPENLTAPLVNRYLEAKARHLL